MNWQKSGYTPGELDRMQQDAIRRTREMHRQAQAAARDFREFSPKPRTEPSEPQIHQDVPTENPVEQICKALHLDHDRLLILGLMLVLLNEGSDKKLLMALAYLLFF